MESFGIQHHRDAVAERAAGDAEAHTLDLGIEGDHVRRAHAIEVNAFSLGHRSHNSGNILRSVGAHGIQDGFRVLISNFGDDIIQRVIPIDRSLRGFEDGILVVAHELKGEFQPEINITFFTDLFAQPFYCCRGGASPFSQLNNADVDNFVQIGENVLDNVSLRGGQVFDLTHLGQQIHG